MRFRALGGAKGKRGVAEPVIHQPSAIPRATGDEPTPIRGIPLEHRSGMYETLEIDVPTRRHRASSGAVSSAIARAPAWVWMLLLFGGGSVGGGSLGATVF